MNSEDLEIDILPSSGLDGMFSDDDHVRPQKQMLSIKKASTKSKRGRPPKSKKKFSSSKTQSPEERKSDTSPEVIMIGSSKEKMAKANTIIKKIKKRYTAGKINKKVAPVGIPKVTKQQKPKEDKASEKSSIVQRLQIFFKVLKGFLEKTLDDTEKIMKDIDL